MTDIHPREILICTIAKLLDGVRHVAVGASSPIPASGAMLLRALKQQAGETGPRISILGSVEHNFFTNGSAELFDCAGQGRIDAFFLGGGQIDGQGNINLVGTGEYPQTQVRWPGSFGSAYLYYVVPRVILFREEHTPRAMVEKVDFISAPGLSDEGVYRPGGPIKQGDIARIMTIVNKDILPYTDFRRTTQLAMGRNWRTATPAQQQQVIEQFKQLLIRTYSGALAQLKPDQQIQYPPFRADADATDVVVRTVAMNNGQPVQIDYRLYKTTQGWRVYDLNVLGAWLIQTYQQQFNEKIQQSGVDGLIQFLTERNQQLASGKQAS